MTATIAIISYDKSKDAYKMRVGDDLFELPTSLTDKIGVAIGKVEPFNTEHAMIAHDIWDGKIEVDPDIFEVGSD